MILYEHPLSPYAQKVQIALREKNLPFDLVLPDGLGSGSGYSEEFASASPRIEVPALIDGTTRVFDSTIILEYIEDKWPTPPLLPKAPAERALVWWQRLRLGGSRGGALCQLFGELRYAAGAGLAAWLTRVNARPAVAQTAQEASDSIASLEGLNELVRQGLFKREYHDYRLEWMFKSGGMQVVIDGLAEDNIRFSADFDGRR